METFDSIISVSSALAGLGKNWKFLDCRFDLTNPKAGEKLYNDGHIPGAQYAHLDKDLSAPVVEGVTGRHPLPSPETFLEKIQGWGIGNGDQVICYDQDKGAFAARAWWMIRWLGHDSVAVLDGGLAAWIVEGGPIASESAMPDRSEFEMKLREDSTLNSQQLEELIDQGAVTLIDARLPERFRGETEPLDPVAGHIKGAMNHPFVVNLDPAGTWKKADDLKHIFESELKHDTKGIPVFYCGSGVTACHNILAYRLAGLGDGILYPGSWSEWITDPKRLSKIEPQTK